MDSPVIQDLLATLDWRASGSAESASERMAQRDAGVERVLVVDLLHLLSGEGVYGLQVSARPRSLQLF